VEEMESAIRAEHEYEMRRKAEEEAKRAPEGEA
jgi:hypothetical protein